MANLMKSTHRADTIRETCTCVSDCAPQCGSRGRWHTHADDACAVHPQSLVDGLGPA